MVLARRIAEGENAFFCTVYDGALFTSGWFDDKVYGGIADGEKVIFTEVVEF